MARLRGIHTSHCSQVNRQNTENGGNASTCTTRRWSWLIARGSPLWTSWALWQALHGAWWRTLMLPKLRRTMPSRTCWNYLISILNMIPVFSSLQTLMDTLRGSQNWNWVGATCPSLPWAILRQETSVLEFRSHQLPVQAPRLQGQEGQSWQELVQKWFTEGRISKRQVWCFIQVHQGSDEATWSSRTCFSCGSWALWCGYVGSRCLCIP